MLSIPKPLKSILSAFASDKITSESTLAPGDEGANVMAIVSESPGGIVTGSTIPLNENALSDPCNVAELIVSDELPAFLILKYIVESFPIATLPKRRESGVALIT